MVQIQNQYYSVLFLPPFDSKETGEKSNNNITNVIIKNIKSISYLFQFVALI